MPRTPKHTFTSRTIGTLESDDPRGTTYADAELRGFYCRVFPDAPTTFFVRYLSPNGTRKTLVVGRYGSLTLDQARDKAKEHLAKAALGIDPAIARKAARDMPTWSSWAKAYLARITSKRKTTRADARYFAAASERWGPVPLDQISREDVQALLAHIRDEGAMTAETRHREAAAGRKRAREGPSPTSANRALQALRPCFADAVRSKILSSNPAADVKRFRENPPRARVLRGDEVGRFIRAVAAEEDPHARAALRILLETGARMTEVLGAKWEDVDLEDGTWRIPSPKAGHPQVQPLARSTVALLRRLPRAGPYVIPGRPLPNRDPAPRKDLKGPWKRAMEAAGLADAGLTLHDVRRTVGLAITRSAGLHVASKALRHSSVSITERIYAPLGLEDVREGVEKGAQLLRFRGRKKA